MVDLKTFGISAFVIIAAILSFIVLKELIGETVGAGNQLTGTLLGTFMGGIFIVLIIAAFIGFAAFGLVKLINV